MARRNYENMYKELEKEENEEPTIVEEISEKKKPTSYVGTVIGGITLNVRKQPNGEVVASLRDGEKVMIKDDSNPDWYKIDSPEGYVMKKFIRV